MSTTNHPAKGHISVRESHGFPAQPMVGAAGCHSKVVTMTISQDHGHNGRPQCLTEITMTPLQWAALASKADVYVNHEIPVTLRRVLDTVIEDYPGEPSELEETVEKLHEYYTTVTEDLAAKVVALRQAVEAKRGIREVRALVADVENAVTHMPSNSAYLASTVEAIARSVKTEMDFATATEAEKTDAGETVED